MTGPVPSATGEAGEIANKVKKLHRGDRPLNEEAKADLAEDLFKMQTLDGWAFDIELLAIARLRGYKIREVPVNWYYREESKINPLRDAFRMTADLLKIKRKLKQGFYAEEI